MAFKMYIHFYFFWERVKSFRLKVTILYLNTNYNEQAFRVALMVLDPC